jgi:DNA-binding IclR family transcriptional regulator
MEQNSQASHRNSDVRVLEKAMDIVLAFTRLAPELGPTEIAQQLGIPRSTAHRVMLTMANKGFLERNEETGRYRLGAMFLLIGGHVEMQRDLRRAALPVLHRLQAATGEAVNLNVVFEGERLCIEKIDSRHELRTQIQVGTRAPLHAAAASRVLLAFMPSAEQERVLHNLRAVTDQTIVCPDRLRADLEQIRRSGYALSYGEVVRGIASVAAPVKEHTGEVIASISCGGPAIRYTPDRMPMLIEETTRAARLISARLGFVEGR